MPVYNLSVSALSPVIQYYGNWSFDINGVTSPLNLTSSLVIPFSGTGIFLQGTAPFTRDMRDHFTPGNYSVSLDGNLISGYTTDNSSDPAYIPSASNASSTWPNGVLFEQAGLSVGRHVLTLNTTGNLLLRSMSLTTGDGNTTAISNEASTIDDQSANVTSSHITPFSVPDASNGSAIILGENGNDGYVNISFYGNDIAVYGFLIAQPGPYNVSLDGQTPSSWPPAPGFVPGIDTEKVSPITNALLYQAGGLSSGHHHVIITPNLNGTELITVFDYATVQRYEDVVTNPSTTSVLSMADATATTSSAGATSSAYSPLPSGRSSNVASIVGGVVGGIAAALLVALCAFCVIRRRSQRRRHVDLGHDEEPAGGAVRAEEDLPPPDYERVFPEANEMRMQEAVADHAPPSYGARTILGRVAGNVRGKQRHAYAPAASMPPTAASDMNQHPSGPIADQALSRGEGSSQPAKDPHTTTADILSWEGVLPIGQKDTASKASSKGKRRR